MSFSDKVLEKTKQIPKGKVTTYKLLAKACGNSRAGRAVGNTLNKNICSYLSNAKKNNKIPCHRVVYSDGRIGGFSKGIKRKVVLLHEEGIKVKNGRILDFENVLFKF